MYNWLNVKPCGVFCTKETDWRISGPFSTREHLCISIITCLSLHMTLDQLDQLSVKPQFFIFPFLNVVLSVLSAVILSNTFPHEKHWFFLTSLWHQNLTKAPTDCHPSTSNNDAPSSSNSNTFSLPMCLLPTHKAPFGIFERWHKASVFDELGRRTDSELNGTNTQMNEYESCFNSIIIGINPRLKISRMKELN